VDAYVGDKSRLERRSDILVEAFIRRRSRAIRNRGRGRAAGVAAIQSEIENSKDVMVEALYPIPGVSVTAAVANAFRRSRRLAQPVLTTRLVSATVAGCAFGRWRRAFLGPRWRSPRPDSPTPGQKRALLFETQRRPRPGRAETPGEAEPTTN